MCAKSRFGYQELPDPLSRDGDGTWVASPPSLLLCDSTEGCGWMLQQQHSHSPAGSALLSPLSEQLLTACHRGWPKFPLAEPCPTRVWCAGSCSSFKKWHQQMLWISKHSLLSVQGKVEQPEALCKPQTSSCHLGNSVG